MIDNKQDTKSSTPDNFSHLSILGWDESFEKHINKLQKKQTSVARVVEVQKNFFLISNGKTDTLVSAAGRLKHDKKGIFPIIGDFVLVQGNLIVDVLPRKNALSRGASGNRGNPDVYSQKEQGIAANLDTIFIVCGLDRDFNIRRIERYLTLVYNCGLNPVIILTKSDLNPDPEGCAGQVNSVAFQVPVYLISSKHGTGLAPLESYLSSGKTIALIGSSGAGKSTLVNRLSGKKVQVTGSISGRVGKGKHVTTARSLIQMPQGGLIIDNPGIREIALWNDEQGLEDTFPDIEILAQSCRFSDCTHTREPGCRVLRAVDNGDIESQRLSSFHKLTRELDFLSQRRHKSADRIEKERWQHVALKIKNMKKIRKRGQ